MSGPSFFVDAWWEWERIGSSGKREVTGTDAAYDVVDALPFDADVGRSFGTGEQIGRALRQLLDGRAARFIEEEKGRWGDEVSLRIVIDRKDADVHHPSINSPGRRRRR